MKEGNGSETKVKRKIKNSKREKRKIQRVRKGNEERERCKIKALNVERRKEKKS